ncbi:MAG TPA: adenylate/guanylate cyclase domain-containing protein [Solirubrobacteraceae bacterium]|nr:adenylate/guanylate cyclase domain-containing protein [Solirubrobacteraceae bacterium]
MSAQPVVPGGTQTRKVLTILFTDVAESTALGQALDPEALRHVMARWFEEMRRVVERHEGVVAKFIGDAVLAVFGVPRAHEDDALRAARAAVGMRDALAALNRELRAQWGVSIAARTGVNSGEVLVGGPPEAELLVVGDPVNTAARLEQAAAPGEILLGEETHRLVRDAVAAEPTAPLRLKGIAQPLVAWRLHEVAPERPGRARRLDAALVGRGTELAALEVRRPSLEDIYLELTNGNGADGTSGQSGTNGETGITGERGGAQP